MNYNKCDVCKKKVELHHHIWILEQGGYESVCLCDECQLCFQEQFGDDLLPLFINSDIALLK